MKGKDRNALHRGVPGQSRCRSEPTFVPRPQPIARVECDAASLIGIVIALMLLMALTFRAPPPETTAPALDPVRPVACSPLLCRPAGPH
jgi:hypothetical protein